MVDTPSEAAPTAAPTTRRNRPPVGRWFRRLLALCFVLAGVAAIVFAWLPKPIDVETGQVTRGDLEVTVDEDGRARVRDRYVVSAPLNGHLARIELRPGDTVKRGDVLARLVPLPAPLLDARTKQEAQARLAAAAAALRQARAQVDRARAAANYARTQTKTERALAERGSASRAALDRAELDERSRAAELASAEFGASIAAHEYEMAQVALDRNLGRGEPEQLTVFSPITGRVLKVFQESEGAVQAGTRLLELGDPSALEVVVDVLTSDAIGIGPGALATLERWGGPALQARVRRVEPSAFTRVSSLGVEEQRVNILLDLDGPYEKWKKLGDGYRVEASITVWKGDGVVKAPSSALFRSGNDWGAFVVRDGRAYLTTVDAGRQNGSETAVLSGLSPGDRVVVYPGDRVADGVKVRQTN